jgi:uncharacterized protein YjbI with pentapeptide repeats
VRMLLYRLYAGVLNLNVAARHYVFLFWLRRRKHDLANADLSYLNLQRANLRGADLRFANLHHADLRNANLVDADLSGADLSLADVSEHQLSEAGSLDGATLPDGAVYRKKDTEN